MKAGTESKGKTITAAVLGLLALLLVLNAYFGRAGEPTPVAAARPAAAKGARQMSSLDPTLRTDLLRPSEGTKYEGKGRNIFMAEVDIPKPIVNPVTPNPTPQPNPGPPPPPPINMKFIGFASQPGEQKRIFLMQNDDVFVASEGDIVNRRYRVLHINPNSVEIEDVLNNNRQSIPLSQS